MAVLTKLRPRSRRRKLERQDDRPVKRPAFSGHAAANASHRTLHLDPSRCVMTYSLRKCSVSRDTEIWRDAIGFQGTLTSIIGVSAENEWAAEATIEKVTVTSVTCPRRRILSVEGLRSRPISQGEAHAPTCAPGHNLIWRTEKCTGWRSHRLHGPD